jgi:hypothetical protein
MARFAITVALFGIVLLASCTVATQHDQLELTPTGLVGRWRGSDGTGKIGEMHFFTDGTIFLLIDTMRIGDAGAGSPFNVTYAIDASTTPWHLDVIAKKGAKELGVVRGLLEVIDTKTIRVGFDTESKMAFTGPRPASFSSLRPESIVILKKERISRPSHHRGAAD